FTKGIDYTLNPENTEDFKNKTFLIYDVPGYFEVNTQTNASLGLYRSRQYPGFLIDLEPFKDLNGYLATSFSKSSRYKLKKYKKRFEASFDVRYVMYRGEMARDTYDTVFDCFRQLLEKRFDDKQVTNNNLDPKEWQFYYEVTYPMLLKGEASLFVIYNDSTPIGVTLNFFSEDILFDAITVFDIDYAKFHLGSITIMALLEWCLANDLKTFDFSKGFFDYKTRWSTQTYDFEYHIYYDTKSIQAKAIALFLKKFFDLKQQLRQKNINEKIHRLTYRFKNKAAKPVENKSYTFTEITKDVKLDTATPLAPENPENQDLRLLLFEYLYLNEGRYSDIKAYAVPGTPNNFYLIGKTKKVLASFQ
ncbi:MAG: GNAT family N-acetyltransferase, partial [Pricia sp.]